MSEPLRLTQIPDASLPMTQLSAPLPSREPTAPTEPSAASAPQDLSEALEPLISAIIARKARQRRYTP